MSFFWNMLQYALIFENVLFTFTIIYITFLFLLGPLPLSPLSSLCLLISFTEMYQLSLSLHFFALSLSLSLSQLHVTAPLSDETQAGASSHATPHHTNPIYTLRSPSTNTATQPDETQVGASSHATPRHTNPIYTLRSPSTNTATQTRPTTSTTTHGLITTPRHAAELVVPSTTSSEPPTIGFLLIGL